VIDPIRKWLPKLSRPGASIRPWQVALVLLVLAGAVLLIAQSYRAIDRELTDAALSRRASVASLAAATLSEKFARLTDIGVALATRVRFRQLIGAGKWAEAAGILKDVTANFPFVERLFLTDPGGTLMADIPERPEVRGRNFSERDWYRGVSKNWEPYVSSVYQRAVAPRWNVFAVAIPIKSTNREILGILVLQMRLDVFFVWINTVEPAKAPHMWRPLPSSYSSIRPS
jgi:hypothetical protein